MYCDKCDPNQERPKLDDTVRPVAIGNEFHAALCLACRNQWSEFVRASTDVIAEGDRLRAQRDWLKHQALAGDAPALLTWENLATCESKHDEHTFAVAREWLSGDESV